MLIFVCAVKSWATTSRENRLDFSASSQSGLEVVPHKSAALLLDTRWFRLFNSGVEPMKEREMRER